MLVSAYKMRFVNLSRHAIALIPAEEESVRRFIEGLQSSIRLALARETDTMTSFYQVVKIAHHVEHIHIETREMMHSREKRF